MIPFLQNGAAAFFALVFFDFDLVLSSYFLAYAFSAQSLSIGTSRYQRLTALPTLIMVLLTIVPLIIAIAMSCVQVYKGGGFVPDIQVVLGVLFWGVSFFTPHGALAGAMMDAVSSGNIISSANYYFPPFWCGYLMMALRGWSAWVFLRLRDSESEAKFNTNNTYSYTKKGIDESVPQERDRHESLIKLCKDSVAQFAVESDFLQPKVRLVNTGAWNRSLEKYGLLPYVGTDDQSSLQVRQPFMPRPSPRPLGSATSAESQHNPPPAP